MTHPEADYEIEFSDDEKQILRDLQDHPMPQPPPPPPPANREPSVDRELATVQAAAAGAEIEGTIATGDTVEFMDRKFRIAEKIGLMPLLKFAAAGEFASDDMSQMAAVYAMIRDCIHPGTPGCGECKDCKEDRETDCKSFDKGDWGAFERHAMDTRADADQLLEVVSKVMEVITGRPTEQPVPSSATRPGTRRSSTATSSARRGRASRR